MSAQAGFTLSVSDSCKTNTVSRVTFLRLADFAAFVQAQPPVTDKLHSRGIIASLFNNSTRTVENVLSVTAVTLDFDQPADGLFEAVTGILEGEGIGFVAFGTFSNGGRFAVVLPLAAPTSIAGHAATTDYIATLLGPYAVFAAESRRASQLRFISANAESEYRLFRLNDAPLLAPREPVSAPAVAQTTAAIDAFAEMATPNEKLLFLLALRHNLLNTERLDQYEQWCPVLFAGFRAFGIGKKRTALNPEQIELLEALNIWSAHHEKYKKGCVEAKIGDHLQHGVKTLTVQSLLRMECNHQRLIHFIKTDEALDTEDRPALAASLNRLLGGTSVTQVTHLNEEVLKEAQTERATEQAKVETERKWGQGVLARMPAPTARFREFREIITALATQGQAEHWELPTNDWPKDFFLRPIPFLFSLAQIASLGFMPHVLFRYGEGVSPKALNLYFLHIAAAGTGKSEVFKSVHAIIEATIFNHCNPREKLHSATGLWVNHFQRTGSLQLMTSEEAESLFGKHGNIDQHLAALHTAIKELFDKGIPGQRYRPSAQVQREIEEVTAPSLHLNLAGTPRLLAGDITETMLGDGFMSRMITYINDADPSQRTEEECLASKLKMMESSAEKGMDANAEQAVRFFTNLWKAGNHPSGNAMFDTPIDERAALIEAVQAHFDTDMTPRYIRPGKTAADRRRATELCLRAEMRYPVPRGMMGLPAAEAISSLRTRAELKLNLLTSILTLIADPLAEYLNLEIMEWAEEVLFVAQRGFYRHLLGTNDTVSLLPKYRINTDALAKLRPAVEPGGLLYAGDMVKANALRESSRAWRNLITDLKTDPMSDRCKMAHEMLIELRVGYQDTGENNSRVFFIKPETKEE